VYSRDVLTRIVEVARRRNLIIFSDEIYDRILYDDAEHVPIASLAPDLLCLTFGGLSKNYRVAGFRSGWVVLSGPKQHAESYIEGLDILANMRLCPNVPGQHAIQAALGGYQSIDDLVLPTGRLGEQRDRAWKLLNDLPGVSCVKPQGAVYVFPRLDPEMYPIEDDMRFALDLLEQQKLLVVQGTGFNWPNTDHFRVVTLQYADDLEEAIGRIGEFLHTYRRRVGRVTAHYACPPARSVTVRARHRFTIRRQGPRVFAVLRGDGRPLSRAAPDAGVRRRRRRPGGVGRRGRRPDRSSPRTVAASS